MGVACRQSHGIIGVVSAPLQLAMNHNCQYYQPITLVQMHLSNCVHLYQVNASYVAVIVCITAVLVTLSHQFFPWPGRCCRMIVGLLEVLRNCMWTDH